MAALMPSSSTGGALFDDDALERDLIDPDDGMHGALPTRHPGRYIEVPSLTSPNSNAG